MKKKKAIVIVGDSGTGKTRLALLIAECTTLYKGEEDEDFYNYLLMDGHEMPSIADSPFFFSNCTKKTKVIVIDNCPKTFNYEMFFNNIDTGVRVNKRAEKSFFIKPRFIFVSNYEPTQSASFSARFEWLHL